MRDLLALRINSSTTSGDMSTYRDSLEKFATTSHSSTSDEEESSSHPVLFHFKSPPKPANKAILRPGMGVSNAKTALTSPEESGPHSASHPLSKLAPLKGKADRPSELSIYGSTYSPSAYKTKTDDAPMPSAVDKTLSPPGAEILRKGDSLQPRPPDSNRISSRPGSGRLRSRNGSRASNHSNKPTPESSGTGEELSKALFNNTPLVAQTVSSKLSPDYTGLNLANGDSSGGSSLNSSGSDWQMSAGLAKRNEQALQKIIRNGENLDGEYAKMHDVYLF